MLTPPKMSYSIEYLRNEPQQIDEVADFVAAFTVDGEGPSQLEEDRLPSHWKKRFAWWWDDNPYCRDDSPLGLVLRDSEDSVVGFFGFIPHDYVCNGQRIPSLIYTATYVRNENREAALGLWMRAHRLRQEFHLLDGGPSPEVQELLSKTGYQGEDPAKLHFFPIRKRLDSPRSLAIRSSRFLLPRAGGVDIAGRIVSSLDEVKTVPSYSDSTIHKHVDRESIRWYLEAGSTPRHFVGYVDESGMLQAYMIGVVRRKKRLNLQLLTIVDAASFHPSGDSLLHSLVAHAAKDPEEAGLPQEAEVIVLPLSPASPAGSRFGTVEARYRVFYHLPKGFENSGRDCRPWEGDIFSY